MARMSTWTAGLALVMAFVGPVPSTPAQNFGMVDGEKYFTIDWENGKYKGKSSVRGYISNRWGRAATNVHVKVEGLDAAGTDRKSVV